MHAQPWTQRESQGGTRQVTHRDDTRTALRNSFGQRGGGWVMALLIQAKPAGSGFKSQLIGGLLVRVAESAHNPALKVPEIALLRRVDTRQLVDILLWRHDDPFLAQQNLGQSCAPHEE